MKARSIKIGMVILFVFMLSILGLLGLNTVKPYFSNWGVVRFAAEHPAMVKVVSDRYASQSAQLETSFEQQNNTPTAQDQLIQELTKQLQQSK